MSTTPQQPGNDYTDEQLTHEQFKALSAIERLKAVEDGLAAKLLGSAK